MGFNSAFKGLMFMPKSATLSMADQTNTWRKFIQSRGTKCVSLEKYQKFWQIPTGFRHASQDNAGLFFRMAQDRPHSEYLLVHNSQTTSHPIW